MPQDFLSRQCAIRTEAIASQEEALILAGCSKCGRRLIDAGYPINGAVLMELPLTFTPAPRTPMCGECFARAFAIIPGNCQ